MSTPRFRPNSIIELDDPLTGDRHLGLVCDNGVEFFDVLEDGATPLPILAELCPVSLGDDSDWSCRLMESGDVPKWHAFDALVDALFNAPEITNRLTRHRAAYAAFQAGTFDLQFALRAGLQAENAAQARQAFIALKAAAEPMPLH